MRVLFLAQYSFPHVGGVEKHIAYLSNELKKHNFKIKIIDSSDIKYPKVKFLGLFYIWYWIFRNRKIIDGSNIVHCHDVFIWYLPFRILYPAKKVYVTFHGGQDVWPVPFKNRLYVQIASFLSNGSIAIGKFIPKHYGIKPRFISYGGVSKSFSRSVKKQKKIIFLGRLEKETGVLEFIERINRKKSYEIHFLGDGSLKKECANYGKVHGFVNPDTYLRKAKVCFAGGYLAALEALASKCELWVGWNTPIKKDYWKLSPFLKKDSRRWAENQTWEKLAGLYQKLWSG